MKKNMYLLSVLAAGLFFTACSEETKVNSDPDDVNHWIENTMRTHYLWYDEIPETVNYNLDGDDFFNSLLSDQDGKVRESDGKVHHYSTIEKTTASSKSYLGEGYSFGFFGKYYNLKEGDNSVYRYGIQVLYVLPSSPASEAGIKRGNWIFQINGSSLSGAGEEYSNVLYTLSPQTLTLGIGEGPGSTSISRTYTLTSRSVTDNPVFIHKTFTLNNGAKVGYLMYNHFTSGPGEPGVDETFNNSMRDAFTEFKAENVTEFVLDLRYNGGGLVTCAQLLATMLAPESALGEIFCNLTYNGQPGAYANQALYFDENKIKLGTQGANLNLTKRLFVITTDLTASASEAVMNGLSPFLDIIQVGEKTDGKNVGSVAFTDDRFDWELHPIVSRISNSSDFSNYSAGFSPDFTMAESRYVADNLGESGEYMLGPVLNYIVFGNASVFSAKSEPMSLTPIGSPVGLGKPKGLIIPSSLFE